MVGRLISRRPLTLRLVCSYFRTRNAAICKEVASCDPAPRAIALPAEFELSFRGPGSSSVVEELDKSGFSKKLYEK